MLNGCQHRLEQHGSHTGATYANASFSTKLTAVSIKQGQSWYQQVPESMDSAKALTLYSNGGVDSCLFFRTAFYSAETAIMENCQTGHDRAYCRTALYSSMNRPQVRGAGYRRSANAVRIQSALVLRWIGTVSRCDREIAFSLSPPIVTPLTTAARVLARWPGGPAD